MNSELEPTAPTFTLTIGARCQSCVVPALLTRDFRNWDYMPDDGDVAEAIMQHVEKRCGSCLDSCWAEERDNHFDIFVAAND